jgi:hypothetical protein
MPGASVAGFVYVLLIVVAASAGAATWADPYGLVPASDDGGAGGQTRPAPGNPYPTVVRAVPLPKAQWPPELPAARQVKHRPRLERDASPPTRRDAGSAALCRRRPPSTRPASGSCPAGRLKRSVCPRRPWGHTAGLCMTPSERAMDQGSLPASASPAGSGWLLGGVSWPAGNGRGWRPAGLPVTRRAPTRWAERPPGPWRGGRA